MARVRRHTDELDAAIVQLLSGDGRLTNLEIARRLGSTESTVRRRVTRLMQDQGFRIVGGIQGEARQTQMVFFVHTQPGRRVDAADRLIAHGCVRRVYLMTGGYDLIVQASFDSDGDALDFLLNELEVANDVASVQTGHILKQLDSAGVVRVRADRAHGTSGPDAALRDLLLNAAGAREVTALVELACDAARRGFGVAEAAVYLRNPEESPRSTLVGSSSLAAELDGAILAACHSGGQQTLRHFNRLMDSHVHVYVEDTASDPVLDGLNDVFQRSGVRSMLYLPLLSGEGLIGVLMLYSTAPRHYEDDEIVLAQAFADQLAIAIARTRARAASSGDPSQLVIRSS